MSERAIPQQVGRYRIEGILGEGAMAVVYAGFDPHLERQVAIKCLHRKIAADAAYRQRLLIEARAAGQLTHPNIVTVFDVGETADGRFYITMERLSGETLASRVAHEGFPPLPVVIDLAEQIAGALDYAHAQGVVHHDIKPENVMLSEGWQHAKVSDFGIAERRRGPEAAGHPRGEIGGTPAYMALEHLRGEPTDARSDLFALGVVLYWLLAGRLPWTETSDVRRLLAERQRMPLPPLQPRDAATPPILLDIVRTLLAPVAEARYQRGGELIDDLRQARREYERLHASPMASRIVSLRLRWAGLLGAVLSFTLLLGLAAIHVKQNVAITGVALDFGGSLGRMIAAESAENLLLGDRAATRALVEDIARNRQIRYLAIADRQGEVIASTRPGDLGQPLPVLAGQPRQAGPEDAVGYRSRLPGDAGADELLLFDEPVHYQSARVGALRLGISQAPLRAAQQTTLGAIAAVLLVTLLAVVGAAYWLFRRLQAPLDLLGDALLRTARGDTAYRIRLVRRDEFGRLFAAFNLMNGALQARHPRGVEKPVPTADAAAYVAQPTRILPAPRGEGDATRTPA